MSGDSQYRWPADEEAAARQLYVEQGLGPAEVAAALGGKHSRRQVARLAHLRGWAQARDPAVTKAARSRGLTRTFLEGSRRSSGFQWTAARIALLEQRYVVEDKPVGEIAQELGGACTPRSVTRKVVALGLAAKRPTIRRSTSSTAMAVEAKAVAHPVPARPFLGEGRALPDDVRALIDQAIAAGKVARLQPGLAAGLSPLEATFGAVSPQQGRSWREQATTAHQIARARAKAQGARR
ncbi:MAG: hypothetical protein ACK4YQ_16875 [Phenylobacterium sp.]|uniref:hypothetical protein n=1 Tax=Phenylobacterium sp. TaxID=1871053 RepID=UPI00391D012C